MINDWLDSIAHADLADWLTVAAYLLAALLAVRAGHRAPGGRKGERLFWFASAAALVLLAVNELLDLQTLLTAMGKANAQAYGWYEDRRKVQLYFILALAATAVVAALLMLRTTRRMSAAIRFALIGFGSLGLFIVFRAASFHHLDEMLGRGAQVFNYGSIQEMLGIAVIGTAAALYGGKRRGRR